MEKLKITKLTEEEVKMCEGAITSDEILDTLKSMENNKSPANDGFPKEFYESCWDSISTPFLSSITLTHYPWL